jgi:hypothetical protein
MLVRVAWQPPEDSTILNGDGSFNVLVAIPSKTSKPAVAELIKAVKFGDLLEAEPARGRILLRMRTPDGKAIFEEA